MMQPPYPWNPLPFPMSPAGIPAGAVLSFMGDVNGQRIPLQNQGWLVCDGSPLSTQQYPELFAAIGYQYSQQGGGGTFNLPDLRGYFLRGVDSRSSSESNDPDSEKRELPNGKKGPNVGSVQGCALQTHVHEYKPELQATAGSGGEGGSAGLQGTQTSPPLDDKGKSLENLSDAETRPKNVYVYFIINSGRGFP